MTILGIESSCDETAAALVTHRRGRFIVQRNVVASQVDIHAAYGGVVPEVAARAHVAKIIPVIRDALEWKTSPSPSPGTDLSPDPLLPGEGDRTEHSAPSSRRGDTPDLIAVTAGPGLMTSLAVGLETARYLAWAWDVPLIATNHLAGHLYANLIESKVESRKSKVTINFPALGLIVSGGHTELVLMRDHDRFRLIGETRDDAAGEAFDKIAKMLGLPYPGGSALSKLAQDGNPHAFNFPRAMLHEPHFEFSFSGLKTSVLYFLRDKSKQWITRYKADIAASVEEAIVDALVTKTIRAAQKYNVKTLLVGGGVAANRVLRERLGNSVRDAIPHTKYLILDTAFATDNAAMIAVAGYHHWKRKGASRLDRLDVDPHLPLPR